MTAPNPLYQEGYSMTDTKDQHAVTVAQGLTANTMHVGPEEHTPLVIKRAIIDPLVQDNLPRWIVDGWTQGAESWEETDERTQECAESAARAVMTGLEQFAEDDEVEHDGHRLASVSPASAGMKPWRGGDARPADWNPAGDAIMVDPSDMHVSIGPIPEEMPWKQTVGWKVIVAYTPKSEPVPATNQAGEVANLRQALRNIAEGNLGDAPWQANYARIKEVASAALATQPATSQEGCKTCGGNRIINYAESTCQPAHTGPCPSCVGMTIATLPVQPLAATPTPPTLSEDLRGLIEAILLYADPSGDGLYDGANDIAGTKQSGELVLKGSFITTCIRLRAALAQVKAS